MDVPVTPLPLSELATWTLQDAEARFGELGRHAQEQGPQLVTLPGQDAVVVMAATDYARLVPASATQQSSRTLYDLVMQGPFVADDDGEFDRILEELRGPSPGRLGSGPSG